MLEFSSRTTTKKPEHRKATPPVPSRQGEADSLTEHDTEEHESDFVCGDFEFLDLLCPNDPNHDEKTRRYQAQPIPESNTAGQTTGQAVELASADGGSPRRCEKRGRFLIWPVDPKIPEI